MADSAFWRDLATQFLALPDFRADGHYYAGSGATWNWQLAAIPNQFIRSAFTTLACRGASELATLGTSDLLVAWLEELRTRGINFRFAGQAKEAVPEGRSYLLGSISNVCQASATLCKELETAAVQAEFKEKLRSDPKNWSPLHQTYEAFKAVKDLHASQAERIPESLVRDTIARQLNIRPEDVTWTQIRSEIAGLLPFYPHIEVIPSAPQTPSNPKTPQFAGSETSPKPAIVSASDNKETVAAQLQMLRTECNWTIEKLAAKTGFDEKTVKRHLSGRASPRLGNLTVYERAFSKALKRDIVIKKMPPKRPPNAP